jgi:hypothetical protein
VPAAPPTVPAATVTGGQDTTVLGESPASGAAGDAWTGADAARVRTALGPRDDLPHRLAEPPPGDVHGLELLSAQSQPAGPAEPVAPFGPEAPLTRPPSEQSRLVLVVLAVLVLVVGVFAVRQLLAFDPEPLISSGGGARPAASGATPRSPAASPPAAGGTSRPSVSRPAPVSIAGVQAVDPQGDDNEYNEFAARAIDGDAGTFWRSERYDQPDFGGSKDGVGLALDLGNTSTVTAVTVRAPGTDGAVQLRYADSPDVDGSRILVRGAVGGGGKVELELRKPVQTRYLIVWFTRVPQQEQDGERRVVVDEIDVR